MGVVLALDSGGGTTTTTTTVTTTTTTTTTPPAQGYPSLMRTDFDADFDPSCSLTGANGGWDRDLSGGDHPGTTTIERSIVGDGRCAAKFVNPASSGQTRSNLERHATGYDPEVTYEGLVYLPTGQPSPRA